MKKDNKKNKVNAAGREGVLGQNKTKSGKISEDDIAAQAQEYLMGWKRAQADYQNLKKSSIEEKSQLSHYIKSEVLRDLFPVLNNYRLALEHIPEESKDESWVQGFLHLQAQLDKFFQDLGVEKIETEGLEFDVNTMEAVEVRELEDQESDMVIEEIKPGYKLGDEVISHAQVVVSK